MANNTAGITQEAVESRLAAGESLRRIAASLGITHQALCWRRDQWGCPRLRGSRLGKPSRMGQKFTDQWGYVMVRTSNRAGALAYTPEHILVATKKLGRKLNRGEVVHHINGIKDDNRPENLLVLTRAEHKKLHAQLEAIAFALLRGGQIKFTEGGYRLVS